MDYVAHMQQMLSVLGCYHPPAYEKLDHVVNGVKQGVIYTLKLTGITKEGQAVISSFDYKTRRDNVNEAIQETARLAVLHLARTHVDELAGTVFRHYPAASPQPREAPRPQRHLVEEDATVAQLSSFALAQACFAHRTAAELSRTQLALDAALKNAPDQLRRTQDQLRAARRRISELITDKETARKRRRRAQAKLDDALKRIAHLEEYYFHKNPNEEDLMMNGDEASPLQEEEDAGSQAPGKPEPVQEEHDGGRDGK